MDNFMQSRITKLNNGNYQIWKFKVELLLTKDDVWSAVSEAPPERISNEWRKKDEKARATIGLLVEDNQLHLITRQGTAREMWIALKNYHQKSTLSNKVNLLKKICALKLSENGDMENHIAEMEDLVYQLTSLGEELAEHLIVAFYLSSLPDSYNILITALETRPETDLTQELVKNKLLEEYKRRTQTDKVTDGLAAALKITREQKQSTPSTPSTNAGTNYMCYFCKKPNHIKKDCRKYLQWKSKNPVHKAKTVSHEDQSETDDSSFDSHDCFMVGSPAHEDSWYIDSGATSHMCGNREFFSGLDEQHKVQIALADGQKLTSAGTGEGTIETYNDSGEKRRILLSNVLYVPGLRGNLISVSRLIKKGFTVKFENNICSITKENRNVAMATEKNGLYEMNVSQCALIASHEKSSHTQCIHAWHSRLGHRDPGAIKLMEKENMSTNLHIKPCDKLLICECCLKAKMTKKPLPKASEEKTKEILELIHTDICGPMQTATPGGKVYFMTMIDDFSRYTKVYLLARKSDVFEKIREYVKYVQTKFQKNIKRIRSDRGGEYVGNEVQSFLKEQGIQFESTVPYTPQQNGRAERKNRYLMEMARSMLTDAGLHNQYWGEAIITANHLQNRLPTVGKTKTPYQEWNNTKSDLSYMRKFGCPAYVHTPKENRQKLDNKSRKLIFVGFEEGTKGYRLLDTSNNKVYISRDVIFMEGDPHIHFIETRRQCNTVSEHEKKNEVNEVVQHPDNHQQQENENNEMENTDQIRRSERTTKGISPERLIESVNYVQEHRTEPTTYAEATSSTEAEQWARAMDEEINALAANKTWTLTKLPHGKEAIGCKWVYKLKTDGNDKTTRFKARLVAQGYSQKYGHDYDEIFAPVAKPTTLRLLLTIAGSKDFEVKHYDIQTAYLHADLSHEVYMRQPQGYYAQKD